MSEESNAPQPQEAAEASVQESQEELAEQVAAPADDSEESQEGVSQEEAKAQEKEEAQLKELRKKLKLKVDGQEIEEEIDLSDDEALTKHIQKAKAFDKKAQELAQMRKEVEQLVQLAQDNPTALLQEFGHDVDKMVQEYVEAQLEQMKKSPEEVAREEAIKKQQELEQKVKQLEEEKNSAEMERIRNEQAAAIQQEIMDSLNTNSSILTAEDPEVIADISRAMLRAMNKGITDVTVKDVIPVVEERYIQKLRNRLEHVDDKVLEKAFGKNIINRLRQGRLKKAKAKTQTAKQIIKETGASQEPKKEQEVDKQSYKDFFKLY